MNITTKLYYNAIMGLAYALTGSRDLKLALLKDTYVPNLASHMNFSDVSQHEISAPGYTPGGANLVSYGFSTYPNEGKVSLKYALEYTTVRGWADLQATVRYAVAYEKDFIIDGSPFNTLIFLIDFGENIDINGDFAITLADNRAIDIQIEEVGS